MTSLEETFRSEIARILREEILKALGAVGAVAAKKPSATGKKRGRPAKAAAKVAMKDAPKRGRGRPRKNPAAVVAAVPVKPAKKGKRAKKAVKAKAPKVVITGKEIQVMREKAGVGAPSFAKSLGVSIATIYNWEKVGDKPLKLRTSASNKLAKFLAAKPS